MNNTILPNKVFFQNMGFGVFIIMVASIPFVILTLLLGNFNIEIVHDLLGMFMAASWVVGWVFALFGSQNYTQEWGE